jgi:hypothetical protein
MLLVMKADSRLGLSYVLAWIPAFIVLGALQLALLGTIVPVRFGMLACCVWC